MLLMYDEAGQRLCTLASRGCPESGWGRKSRWGGVIGICARERTAIRIGYMTSEYVTAAPCGPTSPPPAWPTP